MKTTLKPALTALRRWLAYYRMRCIEINLAGAVETLPHVRCIETCLAMQIAIRRMSRELCKARAHYTSLLPVGERRVWEVA
jgi:hypothetical protein